MNAWNAWWNEWLDGFDGMCVCNIIASHSTKMREAACSGEIPDRNREVYEWRRYLALKFSRISVWLYFSKRRKCFRKGDRRTGRRFAWPSWKQDGSCVAAASADHSINLWDTRPFSWPISELQFYCWQMGAQLLRCFASYSAGCSVSNPGTLKGPVSAVSTKRFLKCPRWPYCRVCFFIVYDYLYVKIGYQWANSVLKRIFLLLLEICLAVFSQQRRKIEKIGQN